MIFGISRGIQVIHIHLERHPNIQESHQVCIMHQRLNIGRSETFEFHKNSKLRVNHPNLPVRIDIDAMMKVGNTTYILSTDRHLVHRNDTKIWEDPTFTAQ